MRKVVPVENVLQIKQAFSFEDSQDSLTEIENLELKLRNELRLNGSHELLHPVLQKSGIMLSGLQRSEWLNLKHLGQALSPGHSVPSSEQNAELNPSFPGAESHGVRETGIPFISRTGKTNDLTKIKGWKNKFNLQPGSPDDKPNPSPSSATATVIKNRSAFVSDLLDEYLEKEGKIIEQQSLLYDYVIPEIGCHASSLFDSPCSIQQNAITHSPDFVSPPKSSSLLAHVPRYTEKDCSLYASSHLEMSPVLEKHFSVTNRGIFIRDVKNRRMAGKTRCRKQNRNSVAKRPKPSSQHKNASRLPHNNRQSGLRAAFPQKKPLKQSSTNLGVAHLGSSPKGGKKFGVSGSQNEAIYISDYKTVEEAAERCKQLPMTTSRPSDSKAVEIISYCAWNESRVKIIKLIAEWAMANKLPFTQRLDKYEIHLEKREATLFSPRKHIDLRATIQSISGSECVSDKPMVQTMVIEAVVGNSAFKTKLSHLISKVSKNNSSPPPVEQRKSLVHVVMDLEKNASSPERAPSVTNCNTSLSNMEEKAQSLPVLINQQREQDIFVTTTDTTVNNVPKAPSSIKPAVTTFQKVGALTSRTLTPLSSCFVNPVTSQNKTETPSTTTRYILRKTNSSGLSSGPTESLDQDGQRCSITVPSTLKLRPGDNVMLQPIKSADGRQLYKHSSGKIFQLVYTKAPEQIPVQQSDNPQSLTLGTSPLLEIHAPSAASEDDNNIPHHLTGATSSESYTKNSSLETSASPCTSASRCNDVAGETVALPLQRNSTSWKRVDDISPLQSLHLFPETITTEVGQHDRPCSVSPLADCRSKPTTDELNADVLDLKVEIDLMKLPEAEEFSESTGPVRSFPVQSRGISVTETYETKWVPENSKFEEYERTDCTLPFKREINTHGATETIVQRKRDVSETNTCQLVDPDNSEICAVTVKEEPIEDAYQSSKLWNRSFNLSTEAVTEAELGVQTHSNSRSRVGFGNLMSKSGIPRNLLTDNKPDVSHREFFQSSLSSTHSTQEKDFEPSVLCEARKKVLLHNMRERESRRMMENRFKILKNALFDNRQIASKSAILDEAVDVITNLDRQSKNLTMEKELLVGKQKILLEKISILSEMEPITTQGGIEAGEIIETGEGLNLSSERDSSSQNSFGLKWYSDGGPLEVVPDDRADSGITLKYETNSASSDDIVAVKVGDYLSEKYNSQLDHPSGSNTIPEKEENIDDEEYSVFTSLKERCFASSKFCRFSDFGSDFDTLNKVNQDAQGHGEPKSSWSAKRSAAHHTLKERESRKLMESRFKLLESTVFNDQKASKGAILLKAINVISDLDIQSEKLSVKKELLMNKQNKLLEEISHLSNSKSKEVWDQSEDECFISAEEISNVEALTFQKPSDIQWLENADLSEAALIKDNLVSIVSEHRADGGVKWEQDEIKVNHINPVKVTGNFKENSQEHVNTDGYDHSATRRKVCNGKDEDTLITIGKESSIGSSDFGSHSDFDLNIDEVNEIDVEILTHSESENVDFEMEAGEVNDGTSASERLCAPPRWHFHNYSQSHKFSSKRKSHNPSELRKSRKNPLLHSLREREWRKMMQKRFNELRELLFEDERISKRAILDESVNEIQNLSQQSRKLCMEKKLLMKKHKALLKILSVLSAEKKLQDQKRIEDYDESGLFPVSAGQPLSAVKGTNEESTLVPIAGTPFHLLLEKIAVSPHGKELGKSSPADQPEPLDSKGLISPSSMLCPIEETHLVFSGNHLCASPSTHWQEEMVIQKQTEKAGHFLGVESRASDVSSRSLKTAKDEELVNALSQPTADRLLPGRGQAKPAQETLFWSKLTGHNRPWGKSQTESSSAVKGKLQVIKSAKGQDILQKLAKKVQEAGIKPWAWKSKREDPENIPQTLFHSVGKSIQCLQKASTKSDETPITPCVYTDAAKLFVEDGHLHGLVPDQILKQESPLNRGELGEMEAELDMDSASDDSTTGSRAVREPKIFISSVDIHSANEANANGGYLRLDSTQ
ncbi:uncharacterized protein [Narcine bancroftii]|uniref:uncharacterized protein n=1 Tax=Narcine bancroftii TaxID=1343680 RepID=UPI003831F6EC